MARSNLNPPWVPTVLGPQAGLKSGDSFTDRSPPGMARSDLNPRFVDRISPGMARSNLSLRRVPTVLSPPAGLESGD
eukprot:9472285-Pyramimonas_sp.AAC.1